MLCQKSITFCQNSVPVFLPLSPLIAPLHNKITAERIMRWVEKWSHFITHGNVICMSDKVFKRPLCHIFRCDLHSLLMRSLYVAHFHHVTWPSVCKEQLEQMTTLICLVKRSPGCGKNERMAWLTSEAMAAMLVEGTCFAYAWSTACKKKQTNRILRSVLQS